MALFFEDDEDGVESDISDMGEIVDATSIVGGADVSSAAAFCLRRESLRHIEFLFRLAPVKAMVSAMFRLDY